MLDQTPSLHVAEMVRAQPGHQLLFVFDELMELDAMRAHCSSVRLVAPAVLKNRALAFTVEGPTMVRQAGQTVHGLLYEIAEPELLHLDSHVEIGTLRVRRACYVQAEGGRLAQAEFYLVRLPCLGPLCPEQALRVSEIGRRLEFPSAYLERIRSWVGTIH